MFYILAAIKFSLSGLLLKAQFNSSLRTKITVDASQKMAEFVKKENTEIDSIHPFSVYLVNFIFESKLKLK